MKSIVDAPHDDLDRPQGVLVVGHGTRDPAGLGEFHEVVRQLAARLAPTPVEPCFLELAEPTIDAGFERLVARGVARVTVAPLVLFAAGHAKRDIPEAVAAAAARHRDVAWQQAPHLGLHPRLVELATLRYDEAVADVPPVADDENLLVIVGRGSSDPEAAAETRAFAALRGSTSRVGRIETAFVALCEPRLDDVLRSAAASKTVRRVVVQPHLLFPGEMLQKIAGCVNAARAIRPDVDWRVTRHLGPHPLSVEAIVERVNELRMVPKR